jgi:membrane-anchored glycerophosphoryl diester phosphodiesterase (GDPDase)
MFAFVQLNDPDPIHWVTLYGIVALVSLVSNFRKVPKLLIYILTIILLVYAGFHFNYFMDYLQIEDKNEIFGKMVYEKPYLEGSREFFGLILAAGALLFQLIKTK